MTPPEHSSDDFRISIGYRPDLVSMLKEHITFEELSSKYLFNSKVSDRLVPKHIALCGKHRRVSPRFTHPDVRIVRAITAYLDL